MQTGRNVFKLAGVTFNNRQKLLCDLYHYTSGCQHMLPVRLFHTTYNNSPAIQVLTSKGDCVGWIAKDDVPEVTRLGMYTATLKIYSWYNGFYAKVLNAALQPELIPQQLALH